MTPKCAFNHCYRYAKAKASSANAAPSFCSSSCCDRYSGRSSWKVPAHPNARGVTFCSCPVLNNACRRRKNTSAAVQESIEGLS